MKRNLILVLMSIFILSLSACQKPETEPTIIRDGRQVADLMDEHFIIILYSEKDSYSNEEEVNIWGTIQYIGLEGSIDISSAIPFAGFEVESDGINFISFMQYTLLQTTTLNKGEVYAFPLQKSGGFSVNDENADFWHNFYTDDRMLLPIGEYQLTFSTRFFIDNNTDIALSVDYQFEVH